MLDGRNPGLAGTAILKRRIDLEELVGLVNLPDRLFQWSLEIATGEIYPGPDDSAQLVPLPQLTETQILDWMRSFVAQCSEARIQPLLETALLNPTPNVRFQEVLSVNPEGQKGWAEFFDQKRRTILQDWLRSLGIDPNLEGD